MKSKAETNLMHAIMIATCRHVRWFRNNVGVAKFGDRVVRYGLGGKGGADLIGVLRRNGRFVACEVKIPGERPTPDQDGFLSGVTDDGGLAFCAHSVQEAEDELTAAP